MAHCLTIEKEALKEDKKKTKVENSMINYSVT